MPRKFYDLVARGPEYQDRDGKKKYENDPCGTLGIEEDGRMWIILKYLGQRVRISVFEQRDRDDRGPRTQDSARSSGGGGRPSAGPGPDDEIPFAPEFR